MTRFHALFSLYISALALFVASMPHALADDSRPDHYERVIPATVDAAQSEMARYTALMAQKTSEKDYDAVHQASYGLEGAILKLKTQENLSEEEKTGLEQIEMLTELVHHASEYEKFDKVDRYMPKLEQATRDYLGAE